MGVRRMRHAGVALVCVFLVVAPAAPARAQSLKSLNPALSPVQQTVSSLSLLGGLLDPLLNSLLGPTPNPAKLDVALRVMSQNGGTSANVRVIITSEPGQISLIPAVLALVGGVLKLTLSTVEVLVADVPVANLLTLTSAPSIHSISLDAPLAAIDGNLIAPSSGPSGSYTLRSGLGLEPMTPSAVGVGVAIIDSGIDPQADFAGRITAFFDFTRGGIATVPIDQWGHGTHVAGIIASSGAQSAGAQYRGLGASARLIGLRVLDANGIGQTSQVIQAIDFAVSQRALLGVDVINLSLGHPIYEPADRDPLVRAVETASRNGIVVVTSAGNFGYNRTTGQTGYAGITSPGNAPSVITVGAIDTVNTIGRADDLVAPYSSRGPSWYDAAAKPDLVAPGNGVISNAPASSTLYTAYPSVRVDATHMRLNGTSMSAAVASGAAALVIEASRATHPLAPALPPNAIKAILQFTATPVGYAQSPAPDALVQGAGALNVPAALALARDIDPSQPVGSQWLSGSVSPYTTYDNALLPWSVGITWGSVSLTGDLLDLNRGAWSRSIPWGGATTWTSDIIQGNNVVWGAGIPWSSNIVWGSQMVGMCSNGETFTWGNTDSCTGGATFTWGNTDNPAGTVWGNLSTTQTGGETFTWGNTDQTRTSQP
jgi:serine protease AprX